MDTSLTVHKVIPFIALSAVFSAAIAGGAVYLYQHDQNSIAQTELHGQITSLKVALRNAQVTPSPTPTDDSGTAPLALLNSIPVATTPPTSEPTAAPIQTAASTVRTPTEQITAYLAATPSITAGSNFTYSLIDNLTATSNVRVDGVTSSITAAILGNTTSAQPIAYKLIVFKTDTSGILTYIADAPVTLQNRNSAVDQVSFQEVKAGGNNILVKLHTLTSHTAYTTRFQLANGKLKAL
jgi:hypothetical protein